MENPIKGHTVESFNEEMQREHKTVLEMGALVRSQIRAAAKTLQDEDPAAARQVIDHDAKVNELDNQVAAHVEQMIATQQEFPAPIGDETEAGGDRPDGRPDDAQRPASSIFRDLGHPSALLGILAYLR